MYKGEISMMFIIALNVGSDIGTTFLSWELRVLGIIHGKDPVMAWSLKWTGSDTLVLT